MKYKISELISHVENSIRLSQNNESKLKEDILNIRGMSGKKTRHLYNNICNLDGINYLEVGPWAGSSFISAIYKNNITSLAIDNWSEFDGPKDIFEKNMNTFCSDMNYKFIEKDSFTINKNDINGVFDSVDIYLYDGCHKYESHKKAITHFIPFLSKYSIIIVDDWRDDGEWSRVQKGTYDGITESGLIVHKKFEIITRQEETGPDEFWNGFGIFICEKL
jgi:hypothetical protein